MTTLNYEVREGIAIAWLHNPPVNGLNYALRRDILTVLDWANDDTHVQALVLIGDGKGFSAGADIREFGTAQVTASPGLVEVVTALESNEKPVIAAVHGHCMGGGLEVALACHYRIATLDAQLSLPEVKLGLLPGAGGTQRLPRLAGLEMATNMIVFGEPVAASVLGKLGVFDQVVAVDALLKSTLAFAAVIAEKRPLPRASEREVNHPNPEGFLGFMRTSLRALDPAYPAPLKCLEAVQASVDKPFAEGMLTERRLFAELLVSPQSIALRHVFFAERLTSHVKNSSDEVQPQEIRQVGIVGAGTMGGGIAMNFLNAGIPVKLLEVHPQALDKGIEVLRGNYQVQVDKKKLAPEKLEARMALLSGTLMYGDLSDCDLIIEAVFEDMGVKEKVFRELDRVAKPGAILASNTSNLDVDRIAAFTERPGQVLGLHFFSPANVMKLLEIIRGEKTSLQTLATATKLAKIIRKVAVISGVCDGFIGNRMVAPYSVAAGYLLEEGASPQQIDQALEKFGFAMGPFRMGDLAGNDIGWAVRKRKLEETPGLVYPRIFDRICELGRFGQKTGFGWYRYEGRNARVDEQVTAMIDAYRVESGIPQRTITDDEIVSRCVLALVNEGARILEEGIAARASDIDLVYIYGYGFPRHRGGPMHYASHIGLNQVERTLRRYQQCSYGATEHWEPAPLIRSLAAGGKSFNATDVQ
ncbi:3-hydroxyacyl-CoA dehydrogenase NAD-binding domain-containing protein [Pseudomonas gingeri]